MLILGIETSCDDTAVSIVKISNNKLEVLANVISSQIKIHSKWGGVVPNLAAREHLKNMIPVLDVAFKKSKVLPKNIDLITVTQGPGLIPALLIGTNTAKTLSYVWNKPLLGIHHIEGHIYANFIGAKSKIKFPILCLVVSGGHTQLVLMDKNLSYKIVGQTLDDAVGEAFDKVARILNLGYPGGPAIAQKAMEFLISKSQFSKKFRIQNSEFRISLPRPMLNKDNLNFSFSGLKTAVLYEVKKNQKLLKDSKFIREMSREFQQAAVDVLIFKTIKAAKKYKPKTIMLAGGVSANQELRKQLGNAVRKDLPATSYNLPATSYTIDNAAMIAAAGYFRWKNMSITEKRKALQNWKILQADSNLKIN